MAIRVLNSAFVAAICLLVCAPLSRAADTETPDTEAAETESADIAAAAEQRDWRRVEQLLIDGSPTAEAQADGMTALHWAAFHGARSPVAQLLEAGADPNAVTRYGVSPLSIACRSGDAPIARELLAAGADANVKLPGGETPLMTAARTGDAEIIAALVEHGAKVNALEWKRQSALMWAASAGNHEAVAALLDAGADLEAKSLQGFTALHFASRDGHPRVVAMLLDAGAKVDAAVHPEYGGERAPRDGMSALLLAVESAHFELAMRLVDRGADPNDSRSGYAPLHALTWVRKANLGDNPTGDPEPRGSGSLSSLEFVRRLVAAGADVNLRVTDNDRGAAQLKHAGATPLLFAARTADLPLVRLLVELGGDPLTPNVHGCTPLMACAGVGVQAVGEEAGTEPEVLETLAYLVELGADVNTVDENRETAMHGAAYRNFPLVVTYLSGQGADPNGWNHKNKSGWTPMRIALGYRPGSFKPHPPTQAAIRAALQVGAGR